MSVLGFRIYGLGAVVLGLVGLAWGDFALVWQPVPAGIPGRTTLAYAAGLALVLMGIAINWRRTAAFGAMALAALYALGVVALHVPRVIALPLAFSHWSGAAEQIALVAGGLVAYASCARIDPALATRLVRGGRLMFGVCLLLFGIAHFVYLGDTVSLVPKWLPPGQVFWACATGVAHIAAGVAILLGVKAHLAAVLLTAMFAGFGILVHAPLILTDPGSHLNWVMNAMNLVLTGAAWTVADSLAKPKRGGLFEASVEASIREGRREAR